MEARTKTWLERGGVAVALGVLMAFYVGTAILNDGLGDVGEVDYFRLMVRGWNKGQLHLDAAVRPELLALKDPYDPAQNEGLKLGDATLFRGRYYIYFGPVPALTVMWPCLRLTGWEMTMGQATIVFLALALGAASGLWLAVRRRYFPDSAWWMAPLGILALGLGAHLSALAQRPMIWELPIAAGIAWSMLAVLGAYAAIHGRRPEWMMALAGLCLGLAVGSRPSCLLAAPVLLVPVWLAWRSGAPERVWWRMGLAALAPLAVCGLGLMLYNYLRFENPLEFGQHYQLSGAYESKLVHFSLRFLPHNLAVYFFQPLLWSGDFPFAQAQGIEISHIPDYFGTEEVAGLLVTLPFLWFLAALPLAWSRREGGERRALIATVACIAGYALPVLLVINCYFSTCARYQADFSLPLAVLALIGALGLERRARGVRLRPLVSLAVVGATGVTAVLGVLMTFDYHGRTIRRASPQFSGTIDRATHTALLTVGTWLGVEAGPRVAKVRFRSRPAGTVETFWQSADAGLDERIVVEHTGPQLIRFGFVRGAGVTTWGRLRRWEPDHTHTVEVQVPSLYGAPGDGWWARVQRPLAFRERTAVVVWFSGGRALDAVVEPVPGAIASGGAIGRDFTGDVRRLTSRPFRRDEIVTGAWANWEAQRGGKLAMRVIPAAKLDETGEPLFVVGAHYRSSTVCVREVPGGYRFIYENYGVGTFESAVVPAAPQGYQVEIELPNFRPEHYGVEQTGDVIIRVDGREVLKTRQVAFEYPWGAENIASNPFGTTCAAEFRGWVLDVRFLPKDT